MSVPDVGAGADERLGVSARLLLGAVASVFITVLALLPGVPMSMAVKAWVPPAMTALAALWTVGDTVRAEGWRGLSKWKWAALVLGSVLLFGSLNYVFALICVVLF
jgi:hypothetical protein